MKYASYELDQMKEEDLSFTNMCHLFIIIVGLSYDKTAIILGFVCSGTHCVRTRAIIIYIVVIIIIISSSIFVVIIIIIIIVVVCIACLIIIIMSFLSW